MNSENFKYEGDEIEVDFDYQPEEDSTIDSPGCAKSFCIFGLRINGKDCTEALKIDVVADLMETLLQKELAEYEPDFDY